MKDKQVLILGIGCTLFSDQGFGNSLVQTLEDRYLFPENVQIVDGGLVGVGMLGLIAQADHLIAVDAICSSGGAPGDFYRLQDDEIFHRFKCQNRVQQVEFLEALAHCQALDDPPRAVLLGIEPEDTETVSCELSPTLNAKKDQMIDRVLSELGQLDIAYRQKEIK